MPKGLTWLPCSLACSKKFVVLSAEVGQCLTGHWTANVDDPHNWCKIAVT